jgi:hypothetical protein
VPSVTELDEKENLGVSSSSSAARRNGVPTLA